jgi:predicted ATPase
MSTFVRRLRIRNYKSIGSCDVALQAFTLLVGRNGAGKSNVLDALRFVSDALGSSLDHAIKSRGGIDALRRKSTGHPYNFGIELDLELSESLFATYGFEIAAQKQGGFSVRQERLVMRRGDDSIVDRFLVRDGEITGPQANMPPALSDRLYLVNAAGLPVFRPVYDALLATGFYNLNPDVMREVQSPDAGELLHRDGGNISSVVARLEKDHSSVMRRLVDYLSSIVPGVSEVNRVQLGPRETLKFRQEVEGAKFPWWFYAASMSDGTLRALGTLVAVMQLSDNSSRAARLIGIEEPETALHPAAAGALMDALREAAVHTQIVITTHSPDLLDQVDPDQDNLIVVVAHQGKTSLASLDQASTKAIRQHLASAGELLRMDQLEPDRADLLRQEQLDLFADAEASA